MKFPASRLVDFPLISSQILTANQKIRIIQISKLFKFSTFEGLFLQNLSMIRKPRRRSYPNFRKGWLFFSISFWSTTGRSCIGC